jgi:N utilization substance protein A
MAQSELIMALDQIEREKGVRKEDILVMVEGAIVSALRKHVGRTANVVCNIDRDTGVPSAIHKKMVVEAVQDGELEISLKDAQRIDKKAAVGVEVELPIEARDFARIAAQTAKQVLIQKIREIERENLYEEYKPKEGEMVTGSVHRFMDRNIIVDLGKAEAILPVREQIRRERYNVGDRVRAVILKVDKAQRGPQVVLSRSTPIFMKMLFEMEVPEIGEQIVEIRDVVRDPGFRAKVVVTSNNEKVDPIGACVGIRGSRIRAVMNELSGERIDLIPHSTEVTTFIGNSIAPGKASSVRIIDAEKRQAEIIVPNDQLALTIGRDGQNIRLACKLTGWSLAVKSEAQKTEESTNATNSTIASLGALEGIGGKTAEVLTKAGITDIYRIATFSVEDLTTLQGVGEKTAEKIIIAAKKYVSENPATKSAPPAAVEPAAAVTDEPKATDAPKATEEEKPEAEVPAEKSKA